jgi:hypothetical protein
MPVIAEWYDKEQVIIINRFIGKWTTQELLDSNQDTIQLFKQAEGRFDVLVDFSEASYAPPAGILWEWQQVLISRHRDFPNWGFSVYVSTTPIMIAYFEEATRGTNIIRQHGRLARNLEDALRIIQADRDTRTA